jgi:hypothetical protein
MLPDGDDALPSGDELIVLPIEESFDLHHFRPSEVIELLDAYLDAALEAGFDEVRLIHGRGKGVQRARVRQFLARDPRVERFHEAAPGRGGWGATLAWLRPPARPQAPTQPAPLPRVKTPDAERATTCPDGPEEPQ